MKITVIRFIHMKFAFAEYTSPETDLRRDRVENRGSLCELKRTVRLVEKAEIFFVFFGFFWSLLTAAADA